MTSANQPVEGKVWAGVVGGGSGGTLATYVAWQLGVSLWHASSDAAAATAAVAAVPYPVLGLVYLVVGIGGIFVGGYLTKHTPRPPRPGVAVRARVEPKEPLPDVPHAEHLLSPRARVVTNDTGQPERVVTQRDLDGDGHDDGTGQFLPKASS